MKRSKRDVKEKKLQLRKESLRRLQPDDLEKVGGGWGWMPCMGTATKAWFP